MTTEQELLEILALIVRGFNRMKEADPKGWKRWRETCGDERQDFAQGIDDAEFAITNNARTRT